VIGKRVTDFLDLNEIIQAASESWFQGAGGQATGKRILVADASSFSRGMIRSGLDMAGYSVIEAGSLEEAVRELEKQPVDVVVAALDLPFEGSSALLAAMRRRPEWEKIPVLAVADSTGMVQSRMVQSEAARQAGFQDCQAKLDRVLVLESVARLISPLASADAELVGAGEVR
jgi:CheY-like chemotaxis protein